MEEILSKTINILITIPQNKNLDNYFEELKREDRIVKIVPKNQTDPMEVIIRDKEEVISFEAKTGIYDPKKDEKIKPLKRSKKHVLNKIAEKLTGED